jgi:hypothetical protein
MKLQIFWSITFPLTLLVVIGVFIMIQLETLEYSLNTFNCENPNSNKNPCLSKGKECGICEKRISWIEYDEISNSCQFKYSQGCAALSPFKTLNECKTQCIH